MTVNNNEKHMPKNGMNLLSQSQLKKVILPLTGILILRKRKHTRTLSLSRKVTRRTKYEFVVGPGGVK